MHAKPFPVSRQNSGLRTILRTALLILWIASFPCSQALAANPADAEVNQLQSRIQALQNNTGLNEELRNTAIDFLNRAIEETQAAARVESEITRLRERIDSAPEKIQRLEVSLEQSETDPGERDYASLSEQALVTRARETETELEAARTSLKQHEKALAEIATRGMNLTGVLNERKQSLRNLDNRPQNGVESTAVSEAEASYLQAYRMRLQADIRKAELQLEHHDLLAQLAALERDVSAARATRLDKKLQDLLSAIQNKRIQDARRAADGALQAVKASEDLPEPVARIARDNAELRLEYKQLIKDSADITTRLSQHTRLASQMEADLVTLKERLQTAGHSDTIGRMLHRHLQAAQQARSQLSSSGNLEEEILKVSDRRIELNEKRQQLVDPQALLGDLPESADKAELLSRTAQLLSAKRAAIDALAQSYARYLSQLTELQTTEQALGETTQAMISLVRREHLWVRSLPPLAFSDLLSLPTASARLFSPQRWQTAVIDLGRGFADHPVLAPLGLAGILLMIALRGTAQQRLLRLAKKASSIRTDRFSLTLGALALTIMLVATWPLLVAHLGWLLSTAPDAALFSQHLGETLMTVVAQFLIIFTGTRWVVHPDGLARGHFGWPEPACRSLHTELRWLMVIGIACVMVVVLAERDGGNDIRLAIGRPATMLFSAALMAFIWRLLRADSAVTVWLREHKPDSLVMRSRSVWFPALLAIPGVNLIATAAGYQYTAGITTGLLIKTGWLLLIVSVLRGTMLRWFTVSERRMRFEQILAKREQTRAERARRQEEGLETQPSEVVEVEVPKVDFREIGAQGRTIVQAVVLVGAILSLGALWSDLLPALDVLERIQLPMHRSVLVNGIEQQVAVTAADVGMALLVLAATLFAAKNLSGLLGFTLLRRVAGDAGAQYAIITLCQYLLVGGGLIYALSGIGLEWSKLQWLVAALGVGLGFGLQEIVANFVSGIILLLERPIRVGDTVTVGDATGTVSRIRIRATTILDWDRKELVVPNKEFVTGRLLNWTLSNNVLRVIIPVGIAYGSDARRARQLLMEAAKEHEHVLEDPVPVVAFTSFGDNALGLELRVYIPSIEYLLSSQTELRDAIYDKLNQAGITIAFPQRDVHLGTNGPLDIRLHQPAGNEK